MSPKLSIIVPVYNTEKYLKKCIESIRKQTLKDIEIILIDDGSSDKSSEILNQYLAIDERVIVVHQENLGQGAARNSGIEIAKGEYIGFVDSDDWVDSDMYEKLYIRAKEKEADMAVCNRRVYSENGSLVTSVDVGNDFFSNLNEKLVDFIVEKLLYQYTVVVYNKIYKKRILIMKNIRFKDVKEIGSEDFIFNYAFLLNSNLIVSINKTFHNQLAREGSTARTYSIGAMKKTSNLIKYIYIYSENEKRNKEGILTAGIVLLFFQQWNYNLIKNYGSNLKEELIQEHKAFSKNEFVKQAEKTLIFNKAIIPYMKKMGFGIKGRIYIKVYMLCCLCNLNKLATRLRMLIK